MRVGGQTADSALAKTNAPWAIHLCVLKFVGKCCGFRQYNDGRFGSDGSGARRRARGWPEKVDNDLVFFPDSKLPSPLITPITKESAR